MSEFSKKRFFADGLLLCAVALAMRTVAMLFGAFVSRTVGAEGTGVYTVIMTVYSFAVTFATSGISLTVTRLVASAIGEGRGENIGRIMRGALIYATAFGLIATAVLYFGAEPIGNGILSDSRTVISLKILSASLLPISVVSVLSGYFVGVKRVAFNAAVQVASQGVKILATVILVLKMSKYGVVGSVAALSVGITLTEVFSLILILLEYLIDRLLHREGRTRGSEIKNVIKTASPLALSAYVRSALLTLEHILIPQKLRERGTDSNQAYADYGTLHGMALPVILYPMTPLSSFSGLLVPEFAQSLSAHRTDRISRIASLSLSATLSYATVIAVFLHTFAEELGYTIYGNAASGYYVALLAPVIPIMYLDHVTDSMLKGIGEQVFSMWVNITDSVLSVVLVCILIPRMGIAGYAVVIVVMEAYNFLLSFMRLYRRIRFSLAPLRSVFLPLVCSYLAVIFTRTLFPNLGSLTTPPFLIAKLVFAASATVALLAIVHAIKNLRPEKRLNARRSNNLRK